MRRVWALVRTVLPIVVAPALAAGEEGRYCPSFLAQNDPLVCERFHFERQFHEEFRQVNRYIVTPRIHAQFAASDIEDMLYSAESVSAPEFVELAFENTRVSGTLNLTDLSPRVRLSFNSVDFLGEVSPDRGFGRNYSLLIENTRHPGYVHFENSFFRTDVRIEHSTFSDDVVFRDVTFGGAVLIRDSEIAGDLRVAGNSTFHSQILLDNVSVAGNLSFRNADIIDKRIDATILAYADDELLGRAEACLCTGIDPRDGHADCDLRPLVPYCPTSNGRNPVFLEMTQVRVGRELELVGLGRGHSPSGHFRARPIDDVKWTFLPGVRTPWLVGLGREWTFLRGVRTPWVVLNDLSVNGTARLIQNRIDRLHLERSTIERLQLSSNQFIWAIVVENTLGRGSFHHNAYDEYLYFVGNQVANNLIFRGSKRLATDDQEPIKGVIVQSNEVGGMLALMPGLHPSLMSHKTERIDLTGNQINGGLELTIPVDRPEGQTGELSLDQNITARWRGMIDISGSRIRGGLTVLPGEWREEFAHELEVTPEVEDGPRAQLHLWRNMAFATGSAVELHEYWDHPRGGSCDGTHLVMHSTSVDIINWRLPLYKCFSWEGIGVKYDYWRRGSYAGQHTDLMATWLHQYHACSLGDPGDLSPGDTLACRPGIPPDARFRFSEYLAGLGRISASRRELSEAKSANYPVSWSAFASDPLSTTGNLFAQVIFLPTDFGTSPERAFSIIGLIFVGSALYYKNLRRRFRDDWDDLKLIRNSVGAQPEADQSVLKEAPVRFESVGGYTEFLKARDLDESEVLHISLVPGFMQYDRGRQPQKFSIWRFSLDATIPILDLHAYSQYYPLTRRGKVVSMVQHVVGWWVLTSALGAIAIF